MKKRIFKDKAKALTVFLITIISLSFCYEVKADKKDSASKSKISMVKNQKDYYPLDTGTLETHVAPNGILLDPFADLLRIQREMDNWFGHYMSRWSSDDLVNTSFAPRMDMRDNEKNYVISMDLPGMEKSDIKITVNDRMLNISGQRKQFAEEKKEGKIIKTERYYGQFERTIQLPGEVDESAIIANYKNGVLTVTIPKKAIKKKQKIRTITVH